MDNRLITLFHQGEDYFSQSLALRHLDFDGAATAYCSDSADNPLNTLVIRKTAGPLDQVLQRAFSFFALTTTPWCVVMRADLVDENSTNALKRCGFSPAEVSVAMVLSLSEIEDPFTSADNLVIKSMDAELATWARPLKAFPAAHAHVPLLYKESHELALKRGRNLVHLSLFDREAIVSSLTLSWHDIWSRIDDLATDPDYQRVGYATKIMKYTLALAAQKKAQFCFLEASPKGLSIYQKIGFKELFKNQVFIKNPAST